MLHDARRRVRMFALLGVPVLAAVVAACGSSGTHGSVTKAYIDAKANEAGLVP